MKKFISKSETQTLSWAKKFAASLKGGEVISLEGNLGAGKTVIAKGIAKGLGITEVVNSPTFVLMKVYSVHHGKITNLVHVDAYRLTGHEELLNIGLGDYLGQPDSVVLIEWGDKVKEILPKGAIRVRVEQRGEKERAIR
ncbi:MAG: tRNA (adenosine(37)-N6)-threonylcarbamoyltransferase complex ATPase subunit type 1 TsaE [Candidatus Komeilibacteria bacterium]